ncbi:MAG: hypothetical protein HC849_23715 [Oscillatoriales cyanobacterium RU_3_3]|nr:hypothetical protein [Oscillatoriales cyanobacterium RU_3_3]
MSLPRKIVGTRQCRVRGILMVRSKFISLVNPNPLSRAEELALSTINYQLSTINYQLKTPQQLSTINRDTHPDN